MAGARRGDRGQKSPAQLEGEEFNQGFLANPNVERFVSDQKKSCFGISALDHFFAPNVSEVLHDQVFNISDCGVAVNFPDGTNYLVTPLSKEEMQRSVGVTETYQVCYNVRHDEVLRCIFAKHLATKVETGDMEHVSLLKIDRLFGELLGMEVPENDDKRVWALKIQSFEDVEWLGKGRVTIRGYRTDDEQGDGLDEEQGATGGDNEGGDGNGIEGDGFDEEQGDTGGEEEGGSGCSDAVGD